MPLSDLVRNVGDVMSRADSLFGTADPDAAATAADKLTEATDVIRSGQEQAASMTGDAITNYGDFAQGTRDTLDHLSGVESDLGHRLQGGRRGGHRGTHDVAIGARRRVVGIGCARAPDRDAGY